MEIEEIKIYTKEFCPNCEILKEYLIEHDIVYQEYNLDDSDVIAELMADMVFIAYAPVLKIGEEYYYDNSLFEGGKLNSVVIDRLG